MLPYVLEFIWAFASLVLAQLTVNTPADVVQCQPILLIWSGGTAPYYVTVLPSQQLVSAAPLESLSSGTSGTSLIWNVDIAAGTLVTIVLKDATGTEAYSAPITIQPGSSSSCLGNAGGSSASASMAGASSTVSSGAPDVTSASASLASLTIVQSSTSASVILATSTNAAEGFPYSGSAISAAGTPYTSTGTATTGGLVAQTHAPNAPSSGGSKSSSKAIAIAVGVVAGLLAITVAVLIYLFVRRNRRRGDRQFDAHSSPVNQHGGGSGAGDQLGPEEPHMYQAASGAIPFVPTSGGGQAVDGSYKVEQQPWGESDINPLYLISPSRPRQPQQSSSNVASSSRSDLGNPLEGASFSSQPSHPQRVGGGRLVSPEKSLPSLPPGASPPIPGGVGGRGLAMSPDAASTYHPARSPPPQYEG
ncbi:hypothetical protein FRB93_007702 [Tulasnella sp. JGI-2019a]|nr:hypothetical protein FRB93_007702 [Tulasnella sp. JGI-2019a]